MNNEKVEKTSGYDYEQISPDPQEYIMQYHSFDISQQIYDREDSGRKESVTYRGIEAKKKRDRLTMRYAARMMDYLIYYFLVIFVWIVILHQISRGSDVEEFLCTVFAMLLMLFLEPLSISLFRTTPGKYIFGITLSNINGSNLTYKEAFVRTCKVIFWGMGCSIPYYEVYCYSESYRRCIEGKGTKWDDPQLIDYQFAERSRVRTTVRVVLCIIFSIFFLFEVRFYQLTPPNKGKLTLEEYVENYNYYADYYSIKCNTKAYTYEGYHLGEDGQFVSTNNDKYEFIVQPVITFDYTFEGDYLTGVAFDFEDNFEGRIFFNGFIEEIIFSTMAFAAAQYEYQVPYFKLWELHIDLFHVWFQDFNMTLGDANASCAIDYDESAYNRYATGSYHGMVDEGDVMRYSIKYKISK